MKRIGVWSCDDSSKSIVDYLVSSQSKLVQYAIYFRLHLLLFDSRHRFQFLCNKRNNLLFSHHFFVINTLLIYSSTMPVFQARPAELKTSPERKCFVYSRLIPSVLFS